MINPVSHQSEIYIPMTQPKGTPASQTKQQPAEDSVVLSPQAKAASGDVDHDGDSR